MATGPDDDWPQRSRPLSPAEPNYHLPSHHHHHGHHASGEGHQQSHLISLPHPQNHGYHHQLPQPAILQSQTSSHRPSDDLSSFSTSNFGTSSAPHSPGLKSAGSQQQAYALSRPPSYDSSPAEEAAAMSFNSTSIPSEFVSQRKFSIDTNLKVEYDPPSPTFYTLPPMDSPAGRRRTLPIEPFAVNIGPFFKPTKQLHNICSIDRARLYTLRVHPKVDRGFFLADSDWTCYRRNYFQVSASFSATDAHGQEVELPCMMEMDNKLYTVTGFALGISARVGNGERAVDLIQHTPKRDKGPQLVPQPRPVRAGGNPHQYSGIGSNNLVATFERLQFKTATANNGKRRAAQQYYILNLDLFATTEDGHHHKVAFIESAPLVVRGRSPGHYADGSLDGLRMFPLDQFGRRTDLYGPGMPAFMNTSMYPQMPPGSPLWSTASPTSAGLTPPTYYSNPIAAGVSSNGPYTDGPMPRSNTPGAPNMTTLNPIWHRARADSLANSECSFTTNNTTLTASSYNSMEFDDTERPSPSNVGGPRLQPPLTPPSTANPSPASRSPVMPHASAPNGHNTHSYIQEQHMPTNNHHSSLHINTQLPGIANTGLRRHIPGPTSPHQNRTSFVPYAPSVPSNGWEAPSPVDNNPMHMKQSRPLSGTMLPHPPSDLADLMGGFGFRTQREMNQLHGHDGAHNPNDRIR